MLGATTLTVTRRAAGSYVAGVWTPGATSTLTVEGSLQPMTGRELLLLPEGERTRARWKLYTETELRTADETTTTEADRVSWNGRSLVVVRVQDYSHVGLLPHYRCELVADETEGAQ